MKELDEILSGAEPAREEPVASPEPAVEQPAEPEKQEQPRDEHGKFASKEPKEPAPSAEAQPPAAEPEPKKGTVPQQAVHAERAKRRETEDENAALRRELAELRGRIDGMSQPRQPEKPKEAEKPVDFWEAPDKFVASALTPLQQEQLADRMTFSHELAVTRHGEETVQQAITALKEAVARGEVDGAGVQARLSRSRHPINEIVQWHKNSPAVQREALREELRAELMAELGQQQPQPAPQPEAQPQPQPVMPSPLSSARNVGTRSGPAWSGPASLNDIFDRSRAKAG